MFCEASNESGQFGSICVPSTCSLIGEHTNNVAASGGEQANFATSGQARAAAFVASAVALSVALTVVAN